MTSTPLPDPSPFAFVEGGLDRDDHLRDDPDALAALWPEARIIALDDDGRAWADPAGGLPVLAGAEFAGGPQAATFLGRRAGQAWFLVQVADGAREPDARVALREAAAQWPAWQATLFAQARALQHWHRRHRHCSACGGRLRHVRAGWLGLCEGCGSEHYPRTDQAVIVAVGDGERLLLGRQASWPPRRWSLVAGFVEPGETLEQTIAREVLEETAVRVRPGTARYVASQPWPFPGSLMLGFLADAEPDMPVANDELEDARWFDADAVRAALADAGGAPGDAGGSMQLSSPASIARHVIRAWLSAHDAGRGT